ncbi:DUF2599 domain-containing protein [Pseudomonas japonica]|uniref:DUF2599 domain-containing protein n=1 Tax=Pseudomonas japonica TaxID=256466 RepID=UPI0037F49BCB
MKRRIDGWALILAMPLLAQTTLALAESCEEAVSRLERRYNDTADFAKGSQGENQAAYFENGLVIRGVKRPEEIGKPAGSFNVFGTSSKAQELGAFSTTYARSDIPFKSLVIGDGTTETTFTSGLVVQSPWETKNDADKVYAKGCGPVDLWSYQREGGVGDNKLTPDVQEGRCEDSGINGKSWSATYLEPNIEKPWLAGGNTCVFDLQTLDGNKSSDQFAQCLEARRSMNDKPDIALGSYPELLFSNPPSGNLPVDVFYFTSPEGRDNALANQADYKRVTGRDVPVVQFHFPTNMNEKMTFSCDARPEPVRPTAPASGASAAELAEGGWGTGSDRNQCSSYIKEVTLINRYDWYLGRHVDSVSVIPTDCGRQIGADQTDAAFAELKQKTIALPGGQSVWNNRDGTLRRQFVCHITLVSNGLPVRNKLEWNLEPVRKEVSHEQSQADGCNTPLTDDGVIGGWGPEGSSQCTQYVQSVKWVLRRDFSEYPNQSIWSLEITPTECGRNIGPDQTEKMMAEIKQKALAADPKGPEFWGAKDDSMRRQTVCLMKLYREKSTWNIESKRPNGVSAAQAEAAQCNFK